MARIRILPFSFDQNLWLTRSTKECGVVLDRSLCVRDFACFSGRVGNCELIDL